MSYFFKYFKVKLRLSINPSIIHSHSSAQFTGNLKDTSSDRPYSGRIQKKMTRYFIFKNNKSNIRAFTRQSSQRTATSYSLFFTFAPLHRWGIVVHAGVDGFSRFPTFIRASTNNKANTVLTLFMFFISTPLPSQKILNSVTKCLARHKYKLYIFLS